MILSGNEIKTRLGTDIIIEPWSDEQLNTNSYDLRIHKELSCYTGRCLDVKKENPTVTHKMSKKGFVLYPGRLYLGRTMEYTESHNLVPILNGKSSLGRLGLKVHATAGFGDAGFCGYWTLEMSVIQPLRIYPGIRICQIQFNTVLGDITEYDGKYQNSKERAPVASRSFIDFMDGSK
jgi:dCTP deaminase